MSQPELISTIEKLTEIKEQLMNDVRDPMLNRLERDELHQAIHWISTRIDSLKQTIHYEQSSI